MIVYKDFKKLPLTELAGKLPYYFVEKEDDGLDIRVFYDDTNTKHKGVISYHRGTGAGDLMPEVDHELVTGIVNNGYVFVYTAYWQKMTIYGYHNIYPNYTSTIGVVEQQSFIEGIFNSIDNTPEIKNKLVPDYKLLLAGHSKGAGQVLQWSVTAKYNFPDQVDRVIGIVANSPSGGGNGTAWAQPYKFPRAQAAFIKSVNHPSLVLLPCGDTTHLIRDFAELYYRFITNPLVTLQVFGDSDFYTHAWINKDYPLWAEVLCGYYDGLL